ncbi:MAG: MFS transporter, partial [Bdellovibrionales bacterium]|nr:MFS transporter [Bdellovibrionales bacterium]
MGLFIVAVTLGIVIWLYFHNNPLAHGRWFMWRRFINWFPLGMTYAFLYMARYNLNVSKNAFGDLMTKEDFGLIFGAGTITYGLAFLINGPLVDKLGGKKGIVIAALGSCIMNGVMGLVTYLFLHEKYQMNLTLTFAILYSINMFFQSYGAVSIIKIKAYWFHVRERGVFGAIFGTLISMGVYFAFDWGQAIVDAARRSPSGELSAFQKMIQTVFAVDTQPVDALWLVFFIPSFILVVWALLDMILLKDEPSQAGFGEFDPHDASSDEENMDFTIGQLLKKIFTSPIMLTIALVEFTSGVLRNGIIQWYFIFAKEIPQIGAEFIFENWGLLLCVTGITGGFTAGLISDKLYHSRRGPPAVIMSVIMFASLVVMAVFLMESPWIVGICALTVSFAVIGVHSLMSGTAAADFGGRKATATASGIVDGCVYLGSGLQSVALGFLTSKDWQFWPIFLAPFALLGAFFAYRMWLALPEATKRYLIHVEKVTVVFEKNGQRVHGSTQV